MNKKEAITIIRSLLSSTNSSFSIHRLNKEFKEETGLHIPSFGYSSLSDFLQSIPETVKLTGVYPAQKVSLVNNDTSAHIVSLVKRQKDKKVKGVRKQNGRYLWRNDRCENSFSNKDSDGKENEMPNLVTGNILPQKEKNYKVNEKLNTQIEQSNSCGKPSKVSNFRFKNKKFPTGNARHTKERKSESTGISRQSELDSNVASDPKPRTSDTGQYFMQNDEAVAEIDLEFHCKVGHYVEVFPCEISSPGVFYLHLRKFKKPLAKFMDKLQQFYTEEEIPNLTSIPKEGEIYVVLYCRNGDPPRWHRVQIQEIMSDNLVNVRFIDYGSTVTILVKNLKPLHRDFRSFPMQAVLGSLANIKPSNGRSEWSKSAVRRFHELAFCRDLIAGVVSIESGLKVALSRTEGEEIHVNDTLVDEGLAEFDMNTTIQEPEIEKKETDAGAILNCDSKPLLYCPKKNCSNSRLQKMFTREG